MDGYKTLVAPVTQRLRDVFEHDHAGHQWMPRKMPRKTRVLRRNTERRSVEGLTGDGQVHVRNGARRIKAMMPLPAVKRINAASSCTLAFNMFAKRAQAAEDALVVRMVRP